MLGVKSMILENQGFTVTDGANKIDVSKEGKVICVDTDTQSITFTEQQFHNLLSFLVQVIDDTYKEGFSYGQKQNLFK